MSKVDRYLRLAQWARKRYTHSGVLVWSRGRYLGAYARIEEAAWDKYMA